MSVITRRWFPLIGRLRDTGPGSRLTGKRLTADDELDATYIGAMTAARGDEWPPRQGRHRQAEPRGKRPRPYATGQRPEPPRIHPLPEPLPPSLRVKRTILLTRLARMPLLTGGSPEEYAAYARRASTLTGTPSRFESPEAWLHHRRAPLALPQAGTSDAEYDGMQAVLYAPGPELPAMLRKLFGLEAPRPSAPIPAVAETGGEQS